MSKLSDRDRILFLLSETEGLSNLRIKTELNLTDERYAAVRKELIDDNLVEKYGCQGGGIRLTRKGEKESPAYEGPSSTVENESALYQPLIAAVLCPTHSLKARGQWQNPDVTRIAIEYYRNLRKTHVTVTTYEVKQFLCWNVNAVFEAASHHRFRTKPTSFSSGLMASTFLSLTQHTSSTKLFASANASVSAWQPFIRTTIHSGLGRALNQRPKLQMMMTSKLGSITCSHATPPY